MKSFANVASWRRLTWPEVHTRRRDITLDAAEAENAESSIGAFTPSASVIATAKASKLDHIGDRRFFIRRLARSKERTSTHEHGHADSAKCYVTRQHATGIRFCRARH